MSQRSFWNVSAMSLAASAVLTSCGGGVGELVAAVAFIGSAGGDWRLDRDSAQPGLQEGADDCGDGDDPCTINIAAENPPNLYASAFNVFYSGFLPGCPTSSSGTPTGRIDGKRISLPGCFSGEYVTINEVLSDSGTTRMFFGADVQLTTGVWVEIQDEQRRFQFVDNDDDGIIAVNNGCEYSAAGRPAVRVVLNKARLTNAAGPFETTIASFTITGDAGGPWSGRFVGISAMRLTRGSSVLELQRRDLTPPAPGCS